MSDTVIKVDNLSKKYVIRHEQRERYTALRDVMTRGVKNFGKRLLAPFTPDSSPFTASQEDFWALKDVSFEIKQGDRVGIIGRNGAGKSTLLKLLSRITEPTTGRIEITGRVASLLEVGTGFHPELTGRENIYLNGAILGMARAEIKKKFDEIVAFAEIEKFLDTPVKRYSSGMYVRLAFAVAAHLEPEILIVDEVLAVGDAQFQKKCLGKMEEVSRNWGKTLLFVSHNLNAINALCSSAKLLENGVMKYQGHVSSAIEKYLITHSSNEKNISQYRLTKVLEDVYFESIEMVSANNRLFYNDDVKFKLTIASKRAVKKLSIGGTIFNSMGTPIGAFVSNEIDIEKNDLKKVVLGIADTKLSPGSYYMGFSIGRGDFRNTSRTDYDIVIGTPGFEILSYNDKESIGVWNIEWGNIIYDAYLTEN